MIFNFFESVIFGIIMCHKELTLNSYIYNKIAIRYPFLGFLKYTYPQGDPDGLQEPPRQLVNLNLAPGSTWQPSYRNENHHRQSN
jgi:hypothetical protein